MYLYSVFRLRLAVAALVTVTALAKSSYSKTLLAHS